MPILLLLHSCSPIDTFCVLSRYHPGYYSGRGSGNIHGCLHAVPGLFCQKKVSTFANISLMSCSVKRTKRSTRQQVLLQECLIQSLNFNLNAKIIELPQSISIEVQWYNLYRLLASLSKKNPVLMDFCYISI